MRRTVTIYTSEHVPLAWELAAWPERVTAFFLDFLAQLLLLLGPLILLALVSQGALFNALGVVFGFVMRNFYFTLAELRGNGQTWGKRRCGLQVIAADGGPLEPGMVFARNLTRELECYVPLSAAASGSGTMSVLLFLWFVAAGLVPLFSRTGQRLGDMIAGTLVVCVPKPSLLPDVAKSLQLKATRHFTADQLSVYGIKELHVLDELLQRAREKDQSEGLAVVASRIRKKIGWDPADMSPPLDFLTEFYEAQRAHLETRLLFGERRESKRQDKPT